MSEKGRSKWDGTRYSYDSHNKPVQLDVMVKVYFQEEESGLYLGHMEKILPLHTWCMLNH